MQASPGPARSKPLATIATVMAAVAAAFGHAPAPTIRRDWTPFGGLPRPGSRRRNKRREWKQWKRAGRRGPL